MELQFHTDSTWKRSSNLYETYSAERTVENS